MKKTLRWFKCSLCGAVELRKIAGKCTACTNGTMRPRDDARTVTR